MVRKVGWLVVLMLLVFSTQIAAAQITAERDISKTTVQPGETFTVSVTITATETVYAPLLDENPPEGWVVTQVDDAGFTFKPSDVTWLLVGSMSAGESKTIVYNVTVPEDAAEGVYYITGTISAYGVEPISVSGDSEITVKIPTEEQPFFKLYYTKVEPTEGDAPLTIKATGYVRNDGTASGDCVVGLFVDGKVVNNTGKITLNPGDSEQFELTYTITETGDYTVEVKVYNYATGDFDDIYSTTVTVTPPPGYPEFKLYKVEVPEYSWQYQTVSVTGIVRNEGTAEGDYVVALLVDTDVVDSITGTLAPGEYDEFVLQKSFTESGTFNINVTAAVAVTPPNVTDTKGPFTITIAPDEDRDCWNDSVEEIIHKYYTDFDPVNETPTRDDVVQAVINAVIEYMFTKDPQIKEDVIAMIKEYRQERPETCPV